MSVFTNLAIATLLFAKGKNRISVLFAGVAISLGVWSVAPSYFFSFPTHEYDLAFLWCQIGFIGAIFIPIFYAHFVFEYVNYKNNLLIILSYAVGVFFVVINIWFPELFLSDMRYVLQGFYWHDWIANKNISFVLFLFLLYFVLLGYSFVLLIRFYRKSVGFIRNQAKYLIVGSALGWIGGELQYTPNFYLDIYFGEGLKLLLLAAMFCTAIYPFIITYAILKYRLMDVRIAITRAGIFLTLYTAILGVPFYIGYRTNSWILSTTTAVILATGGPLIYRILQRKAENILLSEQRRYQKILMQASEGMIKEHNLHKLLKLTVFILQRSVKIEYAAIFLNDKEDKSYRLMSMRDYMSRHFELSFGYDHPLIQYIISQKDPFSYDELPNEVKYSIPPGIKINLIVPAFMQSGLLGFLMLGDKLNQSMYSEDDVRVFRTLSNQAALAVENCMFMEESKKAQEQLFTAEKLASIGGMADGLAHQIKNRLNTFSMAAGEQEFEISDLYANYGAVIEQNPGMKKNLNFIKETTDTIIDNVHKTNGIVQGILNFAKAEQKGNYYGDVDLRDVLTQCVELLKIKHQIAHVPLTIEDNGNAVVFGIKTQLMESLYNTIDNSYEAIRDKMKLLPEEDKNSFAPSITVRIAHTEKTSLIQIVDNGVGIHKDDRAKIFTAFYTTKPSSKSGSGIGAYVVKRMITENHRGKIWFDSEYLQGTTMHIELPRHRHSANA
jgi:signal transduction histidine kinase